MEKSINHASNIHTCLITFIQTRHHNNLKPGYQISSSSSSCFQYFPKPKVNPHAHSFNDSQKYHHINGVNNSNAIMKHVQNV